MRSHAEFVMVEIGPNGLPVRMFFSDKIACRSDRVVYEMRRDAAVRLIRKQVFERSQGKCELCKTARVTWESGEMHERNPRGMKEHIRGEYSLENSVFVCFQCHRKAHFNRNPRWSK